MKKLVFLFVAFVAVSFASCGGNKNANAESTEAAVVEEATPACDSVKACCDSVACDSVACDSAKACCDKAE
ncbi:hypothetical protein [uncultured Bacteroides sp.]|uniref:hypothetical protein n=1 Tax=uncultured Bacteroides sp. TaxID=162156 RepID=UPI0025F8CFE7|nr:hypothetical protein [uncultured Bacteroides sp.]